MADKFYEGLFILDTNRHGRDPAAAPARITDIIEAQGGSMLVSRLWEERRLAYPINGHRKGTYWLTYFDIDGSKIATLNQQIQRDDNFLRHLIIKIDDRIKDTLIQHAQQTGAEAPPATDDSTPKTTEKLAATE